MTRWLATLLVYTSAFVGAGLLTAGCDPTYPVTSFRCNPSQPECPTDFGTGTYVCCSDDPAAIDTSTSEEALPGYQGKSGTGTPIFSGINNHLSSSGFCIDTAKVPPSAAIADPGSGQGCPLPCNPTWAKADVTAICGSGTVCCQTDELGENDCVLDPDLGDMGCYRPVTGRDIGDLAGNWSGADHDTHQSPNGKGCQLFAAGEADVNDSDCYALMTVANQRGFCQSGVCPLTDPAYRDACERQNDSLGLSGC